MSYAIYLLASATVLFAIMRGLLPERRSLALLAACFVVAWSPSDLARLSTVDGAFYQGITMHTLLAIALFLEAWRRRSLSLLGAGVATAFAAIRCYEGVLALLAAASSLNLGPGDIRINAGESVQVGKLRVKTDEMARMLPPEPTAPARKAASRCTSRRAKRCTSTTRRCATSAKARRP